MGECGELSNKRILFISGSLGLGHIGRDLEIAKALRAVNPEVEISWLAEDPAGLVAVQAGEKLLPESQLLGKGNAKLGENVKDYRVNLAKWTMQMQKIWASNAEVVGKVVEKDHFDLVIGDETYELTIAISKHREFKTFPFVMIYDFVGIDSVSRSPFDIITAYMINRLWTKATKAGKALCDLNLFIGEVENIPDRKFGLMLPNRRELAAKTLNFVGYILSFDPSELMDKSKMRKLLGYGEGPLVVCSIGGTSAGKSLLELCSKAFPLLKKHLPGLRLILVCGPILSPDSIRVLDSEGVEVKGYVPSLYKHLAAADLAIVTGGGTVTLELTALQKPFLYFPLKQHFEQEVDVALRCERHGAGVKMDFSKTTPELLAKAVIENITKKVKYPLIPIDGAKNAAALINQILTASS
jgi:UDP-N-acetylglucosamine:LPS N-acetylglucosamine transferase